MTSGGERDLLAPVIPLFGGRDGGGRDGGEHHHEHQDAPSVAEASSGVETSAPRAVADAAVEPARRVITRALPDRPRPTVSFTEDYWVDEDPANDVSSVPATSPGPESRMDPRRRGGRLATPDVAAPDDIGEREAAIEAAGAGLTRSLARRGLSLAEARAKLRADGLAADEADVLIEEFVARGWLDDALLAEQLVHGATTRKDMGSRAIRQLLSKRMVARDVVDAAMAELPDDDAERALEFASSKARSLTRYDDDTAMRRLMGQLARRGFGGSVAGRAAREALSQARAESGPSGVRFR